MNLTSAYQVAPFVHYNGDGRYLVPSMSGRGHNVDIGRNEQGGVWASCQCKGYTSHRTLCFHALGAIIRDAWLQGWLMTFNPPADKRGYQEVDLFRKDGERVGVAWVRNAKRDEEFPRPLFPTVIPTALPAKNTENSLLTRVEELENRLAALERQREPGEDIVEEDVPVSPWGDEDSDE